MPLHPWLTRSTIVVAAAGLVAVLGPQLMSGATPPEPATSPTLPAGVTIERIDNQEALHVVADAVMQDHSGRFVGAIDVVLDVDGLAMTFKWHHITDTQRAAVAELAAQQGVTVTFEDFPYSADQLDKATQALIAAADGLRARGIAVQSITPHPVDGGPPRVSVTRSGIDAAEATQALAAIAGIPVVIEDVPGIISLDYLL